MQLAALIHSYAHEFHVSLALISRLSKGCKKFAWDDGLQLLKHTCTENRKLAIKQRTDFLIEPYIQKSMSSLRELSFRIPYARRNFIMQVPTDEDLKHILSLQLQGHRNRISSVKNEYSNTLERTTKIIIHDEKKFEKITEQVDKVPGEVNKNFDFGGLNQEGVQLFRLYVVPQERLALHKLFVRSQSIPSYQTDILTIQPDVQVRSMIYTVDVKNQVKNITYKDKSGKIFSVSTLTGLKHSLEKDYYQQTHEELEKTDRKVKYLVPEGYEIVGVLVPPRPDFISKEDVEKMKHPHLIKHKSPERHKK